MKIGEFAKKHGITQDAIRHYLDLELLLTKKQGGHYNFNRSDSQDLEQILGWKELGFSLLDIQKIMTMQRLAGRESELYHRLYLPMLKERKRTVAEKLQVYNQIFAVLEEEIQSLTTKKPNECSLGLPIEAIQILTCPECRLPLEITNGTIERSMVMNADMICQCGFRGEIINGIYVDKVAARYRTRNDRPMQTKEEYLQEASQAYINFLYKGMTALIEQIEAYSYKKRYILEISGCVGFFLMQYIQFLDEDCTYILLDYDKERMIQMKENLERNYTHKRFIFLCCDIERMPIANGTLDIAVDYIMTIAYLKQTNRYLTEIVADYIRSSGIFASSSLYFEELPPYAKEEKLQNNTWSKTGIISRWQQTCFCDIQVQEVGPNYEYANSNGSVKGIAQYQIIICGRRE